MIIDRKSVFDVFKFQEISSDDETFTITWHSDFNDENELDDAIEMYTYLTGQSLGSIFSAYSAFHSQFIKNILANRLVGFQLSAFIDIVNPENVTTNICLVFKDNHNKYFHEFDTSLFRCVDEIKQMAIKKFKIDTARIRMRYVLDGSIENKPLAERLKNEFYDMSFGWYDFEIPIHGKLISIPFDWDDYTARPNKDGSITVNCGEQNWDTVEHPDVLKDSFDNVLDKFGISRGELTPQIMAQATKINELIVDYWNSEDYDYSQDKIFIKSLCFIDKDDNEYPVSDTVLANANNILKF